MSKNVYKGEVRGLAHAGSALAGSLLMLTDPQQGPAWAAGLALWVATWLVVVRRARRGRGFERSLGRVVTVRVFLLIGVIAAVLASTADDQWGDNWGAWLAIGVSGMVLRSEKFLGSANRYVGVRTRDLPGAVTRPRNRRPGKLLGLVEFVLLPPVLLVLALLDAHAIWMLLCVVVPVGLAGRIGLDARARRQVSRQVYENLPSALEDLAPQFVLYWDAAPKSSFQISMWMPYLKRIGVPFFVLVRSPMTFGDAVRVADGAPVVLARGMQDVDRLIVPSIQAAFYVNNGMRNSHLVRFNHLTHVQLLHGDSDKAPSFNPVTTMFDRIFVAGQAGIDRYAANGVSIPREKFEIVGRPQVEDVAVLDRPIREIENPSVLYAPTWRGYYEDSNYSSIPHIEKVVGELLERGCRVVLRPHPYCYNDSEFRRLLREAKARLAQHAAETGVEHLFGRQAEKSMSIPDCFNASDAMISDVSSVVADYLYSEKPYAVMTDGAPEDFVDEFPMAAGSYIMSSTEQERWPSLLDSMFGADPIAGRRRQMRTHYLGDFPADCYADGFVMAARRLLGLPERPPAPVDGAEANEHDDGSSAEYGEGAEHPAALEDRTTRQTTEPGPEARRVLAHGPGIAAGEQGG